MWSRWTCWLAAVLLISACSHGTLTRVVRTDGTTVVGELIAARPDAVVVKLADGTTITIPRAVISAIESATTPAAANASNAANAAKDGNRSAATKTGKPAGQIGTGQNGQSGQTGQGGQSGQPGQGGQGTGTNAQAGGASNAGASNATASNPGASNAGGAGSTGGATTTTAAGGNGNAARTGATGSNAGTPTASSAGKTGGATTNTAAKTGGQNGQNGQSGEANSGGAIAGGARDAIAPSGTTLELSLNAPIGSDTSAVDDKVDAVLRAPLVVNGEEILGAGALAHGVVTEATPSAKADGRGRLSVRFETIQLGSKTLPIQSAPLHWEAPGVTKRPPPEEKKGLFGKIVSKTKKGLRIGDDEGSGTRGSAEVRFAAGAAVKIRLEQAARIAP